MAYDDLAPPGQDERWEIFGKLHAYLEQRFPLVYVSLVLLVWEECIQFVVTRTCARRTSTNMHLYTTGKAATIR